MSQLNINLWKKQAFIGLLMVSMACGSFAQADTELRTKNITRCDGPDRGSPYYEGVGMMDWPDGMMGMKGGDNKHPRDGLDLSVEQMIKIDKIRDDSRKKHWELLGKIMGDTVRLRELRNAEKPDPAAIGKQYAKMQDVQRQMLELSVDADNRMEALLTKEQKDHFRKMRRWGEERTNSSNYH